MKNNRLIHASGLLWDIYSALEAMPNVRIGCIEVIFECPTGQKFGFSLVAALDGIANDLCFDERGDWSSATLASVKVL